MSKSGDTYTVAITGSIGCGKSAVRKCLEDAGVSVIDTDKIAHDLLSTPNPIYRAILQRFGEDLVDELNGPINRKKLGAIIFADANAREELNALMHPAIRLVCEQRIKAVAADLVAVEVPLLFEAGHQDQYDEVWAVLAESKVRLKRLMERDSLTAEQAQMRIDAQWAQEKKAALATRVIDNSGSLDDTRAQVVSCLVKARAIAAQETDAAAEEAAGQEYRDILKRFGYLATDQALEQMGDLGSTACKEANASMTLVVDSADSSGGDRKHRELQVDVRMSIKQTPLPEPPKPTPPPEPPPKKKRNCWWLLGALLAAIIALWIVYPSHPVRDSNNAPQPPPIVQTIPPSPAPNTPPSEPSRNYPSGAVQHSSVVPDFIRQNLHNAVRDRVADWKIEWSADGSGAATVSGFDAAGRLVNIETYGPGLTFQQQSNVLYGGGYAQVDRFRPFNDFVGRSIYFFNDSNALVRIQQLDGNQRLLVDAFYKRAFGQTTAILNFYDEVSGRLIDCTDVSTANLHAALSQRFYLFDIIGQLK